MRTILLGTLLAAVSALSTGASGPPAACTCVYAGAPCEAAWDSPLVFAGTVKAIAGGRATFSVTEAFRGPDTSEIDLAVGTSSCDVWFVVGESYLVYGQHSRQGAGWTTSSCTRTGKLSERQEDLAYLRLPEAEKGVSRIIGLVTHQGTPVPGVRVRAVGDQGSEATTGSDGTYAIHVWPHRSYEVVFENPPGIVIQGGRQATVSALRACRTVNGYAAYDGRVSGLVTDAMGKPVPRFPLHLEAPPRTVRMSFRKLHAVTKEDGTFEFDEVQPGSFHIRAHAAAAGEVPPLAPAPLIVGPSARVSAGTLQLPPGLSPTLLEVLVVHADGRPAPDAVIRLMRPGTTDTPYDLKTDAQGRMLMSVRMGGTYEISAHRSSFDELGYFTERAIEEVKVAGPATVTLRLARSR